MRIHIVIVLFALYLVIRANQKVRPDEYYKKFNIPGNPEHTMTKYKGFGPKCKVGGKVSVARRGPVTASEKAALLKAHNEYRRKIAKGLETRGKTGPQPSAANMIELVWDDELAAFAQRWAEQCPEPHKPHDDNRRNDIYLWVGQNMYTDTATNIPSLNMPDPPLVVNVEKVLGHWTDEAKSFDKNSISPFRFLGEAGHFTQAAWANVDKLGCGFFVTKEQQRAYIFDLLYWKRFVLCNYGPGGNINGLEMYKVGPPASKCPPRTVARDGLCRQQAAITSVTIKPTSAPTSASTQCKANEFRCRNGQCIPNYLKCNAHNDCSDGSDEIKTSCKCSTGSYFECGAKCVPTAWVCDRIKDCYDTSDENEAMCKSKTRKCPQPETEFLCNSGRCIEKKWMCDGLYDCPDGADERGCRSPNP